MTYTKFCIPACLAAAALLAACSGGDASQGDRVAVDIGDLKNDGAVLASFETPPGYQKGDKLIAYEGPGWETDRVAWRVYLDGRNAVDIFGKRTPELTLASVGRGDDYHAMADWGMDILKVGDSLGAGGIGVFKGGNAVQIGDADSYRADRVSDGDDAATLRITHKNSKACGGDVAVDYSVVGGSRLTDVSTDSSCALPFAAGIVVHPDTVEMKSDATGEWAYIARYGDQSLVPDGLGMALFYRTADVTAVGNDGDDSYIVFKPGQGADYKMAAAWAQEPGGLTDQAAFKAWLDATQTDLNN